jgi:hypothetical protein
MNGSNDDEAAMDQSILVASVNEPMPAGAIAAFFNCIDRLEQLIDSEASALRTGAAIDFETLNLRKAHALMEFIRVSRAVHRSASPVLVQRIARLHTKLSENSLVLEQHLRAMVEIAHLMTRSIEVEESDGTYSGRAVGRR